MIALKDDLPLIQFDDGHCLSFERTWLVHSLVCAGRKAGYTKWWLAEHVAESVAKYLFLEFDENVLEMPRLTRAVKSVLQAIGYAEVAERFVPCPPPAHVSLLEIAHAAGTGYELAFFEMLGRKLAGLVATQASEIQLSSLEQCVKRLRARKLWSRDCDALRAEIVGFVRDRMGAVKFEREILFSLS